MKRRWWIAGLVAVLIALGIWAGRPRPTAVAMIHVRSEPSMFEMPPYTEFRPQDAEKLQKNVARAATDPWVILAAVHRLDEGKRGPGAPSHAAANEYRVQLQTWLRNNLRVRLIGDEWVEVSLPAGGDRDAVAERHAAVEVPPDDRHGAPGARDAPGECRVVVGAVDEESESVRPDERVTVPAGTQDASHDSVRSTFGAARPRAPLAGAVPDPVAEGRRDRPDPPDCPSGSKFGANSVARDKTAEPRPRP